MSVHDRCHWFLRLRDNCQAAGDRFMEKPIPLSERGGEVSEILSWSHPDATDLITRHHQALLGPCSGEITSPQMASNQRRRECQHLRWRYREAQPRPCRRGLIQSPSQHDDLHSWRVLYQPPALPRIHLQIRNCPDTRNCRARTLLSAAGELRLYLDCLRKRTSALHSPRHRHTCLRKNSPA